MTTTAFAARDVRVCAKLPRSFPPSKLVVCSNFGKPCVFRGVKLEFFLYISALINIMAPNEQQSLSISLEVLNSSRYNQSIEDVGST